MSSTGSIGFWIAGLAATGGGATAGVSGSADWRFCQYQAPAPIASRMTPPRIQRPDPLVRFRVLFAFRCVHGTYCS